MPQEIRVLQCFECFMYQVDIVKKAKFWRCKLCGAKQNVLSEFFRGSGAECRQKVQQFNFEHRQRAERESINNTLNNEENDLGAIISGDEDFIHNLNKDSQCNPDDEPPLKLQKIDNKSRTSVELDESQYKAPIAAKVSKWKNFL